MDCGAFFERPHTGRMYLDAGGARRYGLDSGVQDLRFLQLLEHPIEHTGLGPATHAGVNGVPIAKALGQAAPFAALRGHAEDGVGHLKVAQADVPALRRETVFDQGKLLGGDFHKGSLALIALQCY